MTINIPNFLLEMGHDSFMTALGIIIPSWAILMIVLERLYPYTKGIKLFRKGYWIDLIWYTFIQSKILEIVIFTYILLGLKSALELENFGPLSHWNFWVLLLFFLVTHDFYMYWMHRFQHNNKYLWRTHEAHHSNRVIDIMAGSRSHPMEILINQTIEFAPIFFLLDSETAAYMYPIKGLVDALWGMWIHANVNVNTGKLQYIINGPEMHQWHHANHYEVFYKNYSTKFAFWDWIFGTGFLPNLKPVKFYFDKPQVFGLPYAYPKGYFSQLVYAIFRFDIKEVEEKSFYEKVINLRKEITSTILSVFGVEKKWVQDELFDESNSRYLVDASIPHCKNCGGALKYYEREAQFIYTCDHCSSDGDLEKFN